MNESLNSAIKTLRMSVKPLDFNKPGQNTSKKIKYECVAISHRRLLGFHSKSRRQGMSMGTPQGRLHRATNQCRIFLDHEDTVTHMLPLRFSPFLRLTCR